MKGKRNPKYEYREVKKGRPVTFTCFSDLAAELDVGRGAVAGKFYRTKTNTITIKGRIFTRERIANEETNSER